MEDIITITIRVENPRPTRTDVDGGVDYDAAIAVTDEAGVTSRWSGHVTYEPDPVNGGLVPTGHARDCWMSSDLIAAIETSWIAAHDQIVHAIVKSLGGGEGVETFEVAL